MSAERIARLQEFLAKDPNDSFTRYAVAMEYAGQGNHGSAITALEELLQRDGTYIPAYHQLGVLYERAKRLNEASVVLRKGISVARNQNELHAAEEMEEALNDLSE